MARASSSELTQLLAIVDSAYDQRSWHGPNLRGSLRGVTPAQAGWRPGPNRHNIWELMVHAAYWKYVAARRLTGSKRGSFTLKGSNWFERSGTPDAAAWRADLQLLDDAHRTFRSVVAGLTPRALAHKPPRSEFTGLGVVSGVAAHDLYHAGQIQLLKKLQRELQVFSIHPPPTTTSPS